MACFPAIASAPKAAVVIGCASRLIAALLDVSGLLWNARRRWRHPAARCGKDNGHAAAARRCSTPGPSPTARD